MRISEMNWMMVEEYLKRDDRCVLPLGSTEQHAYLSLSVDSILAERIAVEASEPVGVPVFPVVAYGITPYFRAFPGSITLRLYLPASSSRHLRCDGRAGVQANPGGKRARRQCSGAIVCRGVDGRSCDRADKISQLVEFAQNLGASIGYR